MCLQAATCSRPNMTAKGSAIIKIEISGFSGLAVAGYAVNVIDLAPNFSGLVMGFANSISTFTGMMSTVIAAMIVRSNSNDTDQVKLEWQIALSSAAATQLIAGTVYLLFASAEEQSWTFDSSEAATEVKSATAHDSTAEQHSRNRSRQTDWNRDGGLDSC
uniref:MgtE domain-containing protein n=1 Tax=Macrostomum lignano TaxID=282301 RepID=A0A1I8FVY3_9PLAT